MKAILLGAAATAVVTLAAPAPQPPQLHKARLPGFASELSEAPVIAGPAGWKPIAYDAAWAALARATPEQRQAARWAYAISLVGSGRGADAFGVLEVMRRDDPDLQLAGSFRLARGAALAQMRRPVEAMAELIGPELAENPEACAWRLMALEQGGLAAEAVGQVNCALPALNARPFPARSPFLLTAARAAIATGHADDALRWLRPFPAADAEAALLRGKAYAASNDADGARRQFAKAAKLGSYEQRLDAELSGLELASAAGTFNRQQALKQVTRIGYVWRGGSIEERALRLRIRLADESGDLRSALAAGSTLFRYFDLGPEAPAVIANLQAKLAAALDPGNGLPLDQAAALYWDYRDLAPMGAEGDLLASRLGERLQSAGLYARAAELFEHQLFARAKDITQGPLSVRVATLHILSGRPDRALDAIRRSGDVNYPAAMLWGRHRIEAVALTQLGKTEEALAALQDVPGGEGLRSEILWKKRDWSALAEASRRALPGTARLSDVDQAVVLRYAVALAMLRREADLAALRNRYDLAFEALPTAAAFNALTGDIRSLDPDAVMAAMSAIPSASPAGDLGDLLEAGAAARAG